MHSASRVNHTRPNTICARTRRYRSQTKSIQVIKKDSAEQIDLGVEGPKAPGSSATILSEAGRRGVSMSCSTSDGNHRIGIYVNNTNSSSRTCYSNCYYRTSSGGSGTHRCQGTLRGGYNGEFCSLYEGGWTYQITDPGAFDCD